MKAKDFQLYIFLLPSLLLLLIYIIPITTAFKLSVTDETLIGENYLNPEYVGLDNFIFMFSDDNFYNSMRVTSLFLIFSALGQFLLGIVGANILRGGKGTLNWITNAAFILPMAIPEAAAAFMWASMIVPNETGTMNIISKMFGFSPRNWTMSLPIISIVFINVWKGMGFAYILFASGIEAISNEVKEAAKVDGAKGLTMFLYITIPIIAPTILLFLLLTTIGTLGSFGLVFFLTAGGPARSTELISIYIYLESFYQYQLGYGAAVGMITLAISVILGIVYLKFLKVKV